MSTFRQNDLSSCRGVAINQRGPYPSRSRDIVQEPEHCGGRRFWEVCHAPTLLSPLANRVQRLLNWSCNAVTDGPRVRKTYRWGGKF